MAVRRLSTVAPCPSPSRRFSALAVAAPSVVSSPSVSALAKASSSTYCSPSYSSSHRLLFLFDVIVRDRVRGALRLLLEGPVHRWPRQHQLDKFDLHCEEINTPPIRPLFKTPIFDVSLRRYFQQVEQGNKMEDENKHHIRILLLLRLFCRTLIDIGLLVLLALGFTPLPLLWSIFP